MKYEDQIKFGVLLFRSPSSNSLAESQKVQTQRRHPRRQQPLARLAPGMSDPPFTWAHLTSGPKKPQMFARKNNPKPALKFSLKGVTASISRSDTIGAAIKK
jgi:hypothetical protein